ncbi:MAG: heterodisulfide reductase-related iron-sulfur binding cluster [Gemmatimonadota bacterium]|nr:heterodisulfide reductase-related iron-sulfur binding cluster [Gemmatimonadota bacterium]
MSLETTPLGRERAGLDSCVHCGFCLPACPTYLALEDENDSPRGRLVLMGALLDGTVERDDPVVREHLDKCLGCRGCETACPSGVPYGRLLEAARETITVDRPLPLVARVVLAVFARPVLLRPALAFARAARALGLPAIAVHLLPRRLAMPFAMLASTGRAKAGTDLSDSRAAASHPPPGAHRGTASLLTGCVMEGLFTGVNRATERVLAVNGWRMRAAAGQTCCGALHAHAGDADTARALARRNIAAFEAGGADVVVMNSAGCGAMCKEYGHLLAGDPAWAPRAAAFAARVRDVHELLAEAGPRPTSGAGGVRVAYDAPCHLQHAQRVVAPAQAVLGALRHVELVALADSDQCCGSAGIFNLVQPDVAERVLAPKLARIAESGAEVVATGNPGCLMQIGGGLVLDGRRVVTRHPVELLDEGYARGLGPG